MVSKDGLEPSFFASEAKALSNWATRTNKMVGMARLELARSLWRLTPNQVGFHLPHYTPMKLVPRGGIEPPTRRFSVFCSTNWATLALKDGGAKGSRTPTYAVQVHRATVITIAPSKLVRKIGVEPTASALSPQHSSVELLSHWNWLPLMESNHRFQVQSLSCYHYKPRGNKELDAFWSWTK